MNKTQRRISYQTPNQAQGTLQDDTETETKETKKAATLVEETDFGGIYQDTFSITVSKKVKNPETKKMEEVEVYANDAEPFKFPKVDALALALVYFGVKKETLDLANFSKSLGGKESGPVVAKITKMINDRLRADAKSSAYAALVNKHKPLEGEDREIAVAKAIKAFSRIAPSMSIETVIEVLKANKSVPEDYSVEDYNATPLRKTRGADEDDE